MVCVILTSMLVLCSGSCFCHLLLILFVLFISWRMCSVVFVYETSFVVLCPRVPCTLAKIFCFNALVCFLSVREMVHDCRFFQDKSFRVTCIYAPTSNPAPDEFFSHVKCQSLGPHGSLQRFRHCFDKPLDRAGCEHFDSAREQVRSCLRFYLPLSSRRRRYFAKQWSANDMAGSVWDVRLVFLIVFLFLSFLLLPRLFFFCRRLGPFISQYSAPSIALDINGTFSCVFTVFLLFP